MEKTSKIYVAGHNGLVGRAIVQQLKKAGYTKVLTADRKMDLTSDGCVQEVFYDLEPEYVFLAAAKVGGIVANNNSPVEFGSVNALIAVNVLKAAHRSGVKKLLFLGSNCIYPKFCEQPIKEEYLLSNTLEPTNELYAISKILGLKLCDAYRRQYGCDFISCMPCNLYGPNDNFNLTNSHVIPALIRKIHQAKLDNAPSVPVWGSGKAYREFLYIDDMADACIFLMENYSAAGTINVGTGEDLQIVELVRVMKSVIGYQGDIAYDTSKPDGTPRKVLDTTKINNLGWRPKFGLTDGLATTYKWFLENVENIRQ